MKIDAMSMKSLFNNLISRLKTMASPPIFENRFSQRSKLLTK